MDAVDKVISESVFGALELLGVDTQNVSPITRDLPFISSPTPAVLSVLAYLLVVGVWSFLIKASDSKPLKEDPRALQGLVIGHNLILVSLSLYMGVGITYEAWRHKYSMFGNYIDVEQRAMAYLIYTFYMSKFYEFVDTLIMLLKRNLRQVSYLHVYHHASISLIWWIMAYRCPGGDAYFSALFNSWIHVVMYSYYLLAALIGKDEKKRRKYLFWGKYLTMLQIVQFMSFIGQSIYGMLRPEYYPPGICKLLFFYSLSLLLFFFDFFVKKYAKAEERPATRDGRLDEVQIPEQLREVAPHP